MEPLQNTTTLSSNSTSNASAAPVISSDFETFLRMLTTQIQNQDPLNPMESTEFATQLATFSGVEQQVRTNDLLQELQTNSAASEMGQFANWLGMEVRASAPAQFTGAPLTLSAVPHAQADRMELVVSDENGLPVQTLPIPIGDSNFTWAGVGSSGDPLGQGLYSFSTRAYAGETLLEERSALTYSRVTEAKLQDGEVWLTLSGGANIRTSEAQGLRVPNS